MNRLLATFLLSLAFTFGAADTQADASVRDGAFIHISHGIDSPHRLLMALNMARMMAADHDVLIYFDIEGIDAVVQDAPDVSYAHFRSLHEQLAALKEKGVILMACPGCLQAAGKTPADLAEGIQLADRKQFFSFTKGRILSLTY